MLLGGGKDGIIDGCQDRQNESWMYAKKDRLNHRQRLGRTEGVMDRCHDEQTQPQIEARKDRGNHGQMLL